jgi:hypothetical protein
MKASIERLRAIEKQLHKEFKSEFFLDTVRGSSLKERWNRMHDALCGQGIDTGYDDFNHMLTDFPY